jgi:hypothetical protein
MTGIRICGMFHEKLPVPECKEMLKENTFLFAVLPLLLSPSLKN